MKIWVDDIRKPPYGYVWCKSVNEAIHCIESHEEEIQWLMDIAETVDCYNCQNYWGIDIIDLDHDAGDYASDGGDYIKLLDWLEETGRSYPIRIHSMNPVGVENMRRVIERNNWVEVR